MKLFYLNVCEWVLSMMLAYACNCIYQTDASNESIYADINLNFVKDLEEDS